MRTGLYLTLLLTLLLSACSRETPETGQTPSTSSDGRAYVEAGDLDALARRGQLRILVHRLSDDYLPRAGYPLDVERQMAQRFAREQGLEPVLVPVAKYGDLLDELQAGRGDLVVANLTVTPARAERVAFTLGVDQSREVLVGRAAEPPVDNLADLSGRSVAVMRDTSFWELQDQWRQRAGQVQVIPLPATLTSDQVLDALVAGDYDFAVQDSNVMDVVRHYRQDVAVKHTLGEARPLAWAVRPENPQLLDALNAFLTRERMTRSHIRPHTDDLDGIRERGVLRVITRNNSATYYLYRGELVGFEYELARRLAEALDLRLQMVVADDYEAMQSMLLAGEGDLIAAYLARTPEREAQVAFGRRYHYATETLVGRADEPELTSVEQLAGRRLYLRPTSSYWRTAETLREQQGIDVTLVPVPTDMETEEIIERVASGEFDLTLADSHLLQLELTWRDDIRALLPLGEPVSHHWALRPDNPQLLAAVDDFWRSEYRGLHYNILYQRYFENHSRIRQHRTGRADLAEGSALSPWDDITRYYAQRYGFDWRLILAQMYQESRFDPEAVSWVGARGLMQIMPRTAEELGLSPLDDPEVSVHAGVKYLDWLRDRFPERLPVDEQMWFSLAAYNAGVGHVREARRLAERKGWNPDRWFGNVERAMLLLSRPEYHSQSRFGYVRGQEPVNYVRHIRDRYRAYARLAPE